MVWWCARGVGVVWWWGRGVAVVWWWGRGVGVVWCACGGQVGAHPCLDGAVVPQNKDSTIRVVLLGWEGGCVNGYVRVPIREELV